MIGHLGFGDPELPDAGHGACCAGAAIYGPVRCTCWRDVHDLAQAEPRSAPAEVRDRMCGDCAYRPGSPEKAGDPDHAGDQDSLEHLAQAATPFWCHDGIRRIVARHHPAGAQLPGHPAAYDPPIRDGVPYRADGQPGLLCAGWDARRRALAARHPGGDLDAQADT